MIIDQQFVITSPKYKTLNELNTSICIPEISIVRRSGFISSCKIFQLQSFAVFLS